MRNEKLQLLEYALGLAKKNGMDGAEASYASSGSVSASIRLGKPEGIERSESEAIAVRLFSGRRQAVASSSDLSREAIATLVERVADMARAAPEDPYALLASENDIIKKLPELDLFDASEPSADDLQRMALATEDVALAVNGITNSEGAEASCSHSYRHKMASNGLDFGYSSSASGLSISVLAGHGANMQRDYAYSSKRFLGDLESAQKIGQEAAERTLARLNPAKPPTGKSVIVFDQRIGRQILGSFASAINGSAIARGTSFLKNKRGEKIFSAAVNIIDDPLIKRGLASRPCDSEGIAGRKTNLVENGILKEWLLDIATAAQLGLTTTGHASQGLGSTPSPSPSNLYLAAGKKSKDELIANIKSGIYISEVFGMGVNLVTGDYSQGASGFMIENGQISHPVSEFTIAGHLLEMFKNLEAANDLEFRYGINAPTISVGEMMVAGA